MEPEDRDGTGRANSHGDDLDNLIRGIPAFDEADTTASIKLPIVSQPELDDTLHRKIPNEIAGRPEPVPSIIQSESGIGDTAMPIAVAPLRRSPRNARRATIVVAGSCLVAVGVAAALQHDDGTSSASKSQVGIGTTTAYGPTSRSANPVDSLQQPVASLGLSSTTIAGATSITSGSASTSSIGGLSSPTSTTISLSGEQGATTNAGVLSTTSAAPTPTTRHIVVTTTVRVTTTTHAVALVGDLNGDDKIGCADFSILHAQYGQSGSGLAGDLNHDGTVSIFDLSIMASHWTADGTTSAGCPNP